MNIADELNAHEDKLWRLIAPALRQWEKETGLVMSQIDIRRVSGCLDGIEVSFSTIQS